MNNNKPLDSQEKLERAKRIADKKTSRSTNTISSKAAGISHFINGLVNKLFFDKTLSAIFSLLLAILLYFVVNNNTVVSTSIEQSTVLKSMPVKVVYNSEMYEISGIPETVDVLVAGEMSDITLQKSQLDSYILCDLSGLIEGKYDVSLTPDNFISSLSVYVLNTPNVNVTIKKKTTETFTITPTYINLNKMDSSYTITNLILSQSEVMIRASQDTLDSISYVRAIIDVSNVTTSFTQEPKIVAYDQIGSVVNCDIIYEKINAEVTVTRLSKEIPIKINTIGKLSEGLAIDSISSDFSFVTIYASQSVLDSTTELVVDLDISNISSNTVLSTPLIKPVDVSNMNVTKITLSINVGQSVEKVLNGIKTQWVNNTHSQFAVTNTSDSSLDIKLVGTMNNLEKITANNVTILFDMTDTVIGVQEVPVIIKVNNQFVQATLSDGRTTVEVQVVE